MAELLYQAIMKVPGLAGTAYQRQQQLYEKLGSPQGGYAGTYNQNVWLLGQVNAGVTGAAPPPTTAAEVQPFLTQSQISLAQSTALPAVRTEEQVASDLATKGIETAPLGTRPAVPSLKEEYKTLREEQGVEGLEAQLNELKGQEADIDATLRQQKAAERGKPVAMNVIEGRISEETRQQQEALDFVQRQKARIVDELQMRYATISTMMSLTQQDYANTLADYNAKFSQNLQVINLIRDIRQEEKDDVQKAKDNARANLQIYWNAITEGGLNVNTLPADQKIEIAKMEVASGLPVGFMAAIKVPDKLLATIDLNNGQTQLLFRKQDGSTFTQTYGTVTPKAATGGVTAYQAYQMEQDQKKQLVSSAIGSFKGGNKDKWVDANEARDTYRNILGLAGGDTAVARALYNQAFNEGGYVKYGNYTL